MSGGRAKLPRRLHLPSGRVVSLEARGAPAGERRRPDAPLFDEVFALADRVTLASDGRPVALDDLALSDFHALRAVLCATGWIHEEPIEIECRNCRRPYAVTPSAAMPLGPLRDGELGDGELDATAPFGEPIAIAPIEREGGPAIEEVVLEPRTAGEARPAFAALARRELTIDVGLVRALGVARLGDERDPEVIAELLAGASDDAWNDVGDAFLGSHYPPRLFGLTHCPECGARNDVDAPYEREVVPSEPRRQGDADEEIPPPEAFAAEARAIFERWAEDVPGDPVELVVDEGTPACDDGGELLLGAYLPPVKGDERTPTRPGSVTVYVRTFRAMWDEDGPYDWRAELEETIEHELEHHAGWLAGDDPMDDEERDAIAAEAVRVHGKREIARQGASALATDLLGFWRRTWIVWVVAALLAVGFVVCAR